MKAVKHVGLLPGINLSDRYLYEVVLSDWPPILLYGSQSLTQHQGCFQSSSCETFIGQQIPFLAKSPQSNVAGFCGAGGHVRGVFIHSAEALGRSEESCIRNDMPHKKLLIMFSQALTGVFRQTDSFCSHCKMNIIGLLCMQISILLDVYASMWKGVLI